jgi:signal transduction histidine kinase
MAMRAGDPERANLFLGNALKVIARGRELTERLAAASYACEQTGHVDVHALIDELLLDERDLLPSAATTYEAANSTVQGDAAFLREAIRNLLANAREAGASEGGLAIATRNAAGADVRGDATRDYLVVILTDAGGGMSDEVRHQAFELFFSTREAKAGRGDGLAQAKDAVRRAGGFVSIDSTAGKGTTVTLSIPLAEAIE